MALDLKNPDGVEFALNLVDRADVVLEGFRPGVMERLGLGPDECLRRNPRLVYGRITGWGQSGPLAQAAGHDLNYIALTGALNVIGRAGQPSAIPLNMLGDNAGGSLAARVRTGLNDSFRGPVNRHEQSAHYTTPRLFCAFGVRFPHEPVALTGSDLRRFRMWSRPILK